MRSRTWLNMGFLLGSMLAPLAASAADRIVLGILTHEAAKENVEFQQYDRMLPLYRERHIEPTLIELNCRGWPEDKIYAMLKTCHVVRFTTGNENPPLLTPAERARLQTFGVALARYVREGGGLFIEPQGNRYPGQDSEKYWNVPLEPFGLQILEEGCYDKTRACTTNLLPGHTEPFWFTRNIKPHPSTTNVACLYLPLHGQSEGFAFNGVPAMKYSPEWQVVAAGEKEAKSYVMGADEIVNLDAQGTFGSEPPVAAVRDFGKGRVFCFSIPAIFSGSQLSNPMWTPVVETLGDPVAKRPSDSFRLWMNAYAWLAEPSRGLTNFGTYRPEPYRPVRFPKLADGAIWKAAFSNAQPAWGAPAGGVRGIIGAHSAYTDGKGSVADYAKAGKAAGLSMIVFTDPMEKHTAQTWEKFKTDCAAASDAGFLAVPGAEFTDSSGDRWIVTGDKVQYPAATAITDHGRCTQPMWDGQRILLYGSYIQLSSCPKNALLDYRQFRANGHHAENMWWSWNHIPFAYDRDKLLADNSSDYLFAMRDLRWTCEPLSFTRITDPADVALAARTCFTGYADFNQMSAIRTSSWGKGSTARYVSQGPLLAYWAALNSQADGEWPHTGGTQPVRLKFVARSEDGIAEVKVHDADTGLIRRFAGNGAKELTRGFVLCHDKQHYPTLEITDVKGRKAFSSHVKVYDYKFGSYRCGDNLNTLSQGTQVFHPDRIERPFSRGFLNAGVIGEGWLGGCPVPHAGCPDMVSTKEFGQYPDRSNIPVPYKEPESYLRAQKLLNVVLASQNIQIFRMEMNKLAKLGVNRKAGASSTAEANHATDVGDLEVFETTDTMVSPTGRADMKVCYDYRRWHEGMQNYRGEIVWHEGEIRIKKDVTLLADKSYLNLWTIPLAAMVSPIDLEKKIGTSLKVVDAEGGPRELKLNEISATGRIRSGGYIAQLPTPVGYLAFLAPPDSDFTYSVKMLKNTGRVTVGLGSDGQAVKAGTVLKYRFAIATMADPKMPGPEALDHTVQAMNFGGGTNGYPITMKAGETEDATFFFTALAKDHEAVFSLGPKRLLIELPIRVKGVDDNGCMAIFTAKRPWFRFVPAVKDPPSEKLGTAWFQEDIDEANEIWAGNIFVCDDPALRVTAVLEGLPSGLKPFIEVHNPTEKEIATEIHSPAHTPRYGGMRGRISLPPGASRMYLLDNQEFTAMPPEMETALLN